MKVAVFCTDSLRRQLRPAGDAEVEFRFFPPLVDAAGSYDLAGVKAALVELPPAPRRGPLAALRSDLGSRPLASISHDADPATLRASARAPFDFHVFARGGRGTADEVAARLRAGGRGAAAGGVSAAQSEHRLRVTAQRLAILSEIVRAANSLLEPAKIVELIMARLQELIPCEAWSVLMVDEEKRELRFEAALGEKGRDVSNLRVRLGEGIAGWVAQSGQAAIVNDTTRDPRFATKFDAETRFRTRSVLCAPLQSRGRTIGVVEIINRREGDFSQDDLDVLLTLVEPCAIAIENATLFQRTQQLTITDDLTQLFNSRYLNLYLERELKRCKRHGIPLSLIFLDLDGFKGVNDQYGHLAGSRTLTEVGHILVEAVRESDIIARYGGDEFVIVLPETPPSGALVIGERIRRSVEGHVFLQDQGIVARISASFGIASYPEHALTAEGLVQKADQAMYRVKERNKNGIEMAV